MTYSYGQAVITWQQTGTAGECLLYAKKVSAGKVDTGAQGLGTHLSGEAAVAVDGQVPYQGSVDGQSVSSTLTPPADDFGLGRAWENPFGIDAGEFERGLRIEAAEISPTPRVAEAGIPRIDQLITDWVGNLVEALKKIRFLQ